MIPLPKKAVVRLRLASEEIGLHYRVLGRGPALLMLHPSPLSSAFMVPHMQRFANQVTAIAPDTPGYGRSTAIKGEVRDLTPYVEAMCAFCDALGLTSYALYGSATGAQIAIELAKADAQRVTGVILDNAADFTNTECEHIMHGYFPDVTPCEDGSHLARVWRVAHDSTLFFPWHLKEETNRIASEPGSPEVMNMTALGYLQAGPGYEKAYRAAFRNERAERVRSISAPVSIIRWKSSILKTFTDRFDRYAWRDNTRMAHCDEGMEARLRCIEAELPRVLGEPAVLRSQTWCNGPKTRYVDTSFGQVRFRVIGDAPRKVLLHAPGASIDSLNSELDGGDLVVVDLPGHGESDCPQMEEASEYLHACAEALENVAQACAMREVTVEGEGGSARLASLLAAKCGAASTPASVYKDELKAPPELVSLQGGEHLWRGWYWLRAQYLGPDRIMPNSARLTQMLLDLLRSQRAHGLLHRLLEDEP